ncbi:MAG: helix-turn-helix transcriptional regulator [Flavisolibacter sp.]
MALENDIAYFVKYNRNKARMTQEELAARAGVGLRFIRDLEQGKETLRIDKVNQVLSLFGYKMIPGTSRHLDPYEVLMNYNNIAVHLYLKNRTELYGIILGPDYEDSQIKAWRFISNNNAKQYKETEDPALVQIVNHTDIEKIETQ